MDDNDSPLQDADFKALFLCLEHLLRDIHECKEQKAEAETAEESARIQSHHDLLMEKFDERLQDVETDAQRHYVMQNLPFAAKPKTSQLNPINQQNQERKLGWHRTLSNIWEQPEPFPAIYGWLEFQYIECETLKGQIATATPKELPVLEKQLAVVSAEYLELANKVITNGCRHGISSLNSGRLD